MTLRKNFLMMLTLLGLLVLAACGGQTEPAAVAEPETAAEPAAETAAEPAAEAGGTQTFVVDSGASTASYIVQEEFFAEALEKLGIEAGKTEVVGVSRQVSGEMTLNLDDSQNLLGANSFSVDLTGLQTDQNRRDSWIQENGPTFSRFPTAEFVGTEIQGFPADYTAGEEVSFQLVGDLTVRETTVPVTFDVTATLEGNTLTGTAVADMQLTDFGIDPPDFANTLTVQNDFQIRLNLVANAQ